MNEIVTVALTIVVVVFVFLWLKWSFIFMLAAMLEREPQSITKDIGFGFRFLPIALLMGFFLVFVDLMPEA